MNENRPAPVPVTLSGTSALLLLRLMEELKTEDGGGVISRALGLFDLALRARRDGKALCLVDPASGQRSEVAL